MLTRIQHDWTPVGLLEESLKQFFLTVAVVDLTTAIHFLSPSSVLLAGNPHLQRPYTMDSPPWNKRDLATTHFYLEKEARDGSMVLLSFRY